MNQSLWSYENMRNLLVDNDKFKQTDGARFVFDEWYRLAKQFAQGQVNADQMVQCTDDCFQTMFIVYSPGAFTKQNMDYYVISSLMKAFRNILTILDSKPKFQVLRDHPSFVRLMSWLQQSIIPQLVIGAKNDRIDSIARVEYSDSIGSLLEFGRSLSAVYPISYPTVPFFLYSSDYYTLAFNTAENLSMRQSVLRSVTQMIEIDSTRMMAIVSPQLRDSEGCSVIWSFTALTNKDSVQIMQKGFSVVIRKRGIEALLMFYNSLNDVKLAIDCLTKTNTIINTVMYHFCNVASTIVANTTVPSSNELSTIPEEIIAGRVFLQSLTHYFPNNHYVLDFLFSQLIINLFPIASIISPYIDIYDDYALLHYIFPYLQTSITTMSIAGVSGNEEDQDTVNLLRDIAVFLINSSTRPIDYDVGKALFSTLILAMRRGYIETERFPELTANIIAYYAIKPSSLASDIAINTIKYDSSTWIAGIFEGSDDRHRDIRALKEVVCVVLGMKEVEGTINSKIDTEISELIMEQFLRIRHIEVLQIMRDILLTVDLNADSISFSIQSKLLYSINNWIINDSQYFKPEAIKTVFLPLLRALTPIIHRSLVYLLLEVTTRVLLIYNNNNGNHSFIEGQQNDLYNVHNMKTFSQNVVDDSLICGILERAPQDDTTESGEMYYTSTSIIEKCIEVAGSEARISIAHFFPYYCLEDEEVSVRQEALRSIKKYPELVYKYKNEILSGLDRRIGGDEAHIRLGLSDLFIASAPTLELLAKHDLSIAPQCLVYLIEGIEHSKENDPQSKPNGDLLRVLHSIYDAYDVNCHQAIIEVLKSYDHGYLSILRTYCSEWFLHDDDDEEIQQSPIIAQNTIQSTQILTDSWSMYWNQVKISQLKGPNGFLESLYYIHTIRIYETSSVRQQILTNYLMTNLLPTISAYFLPQQGFDRQFIITPIVLQNAMSVLNIIQIIHQLFPQEGEYLLHLSRMAQQIVIEEKNINADEKLINILEKQVESILCPLIASASASASASQAPQMDSRYLPSQQETSSRLLSSQIQGYISPQQADLLQQTHGNTSQTHTPQVMYMQFPVVKGYIPPQRVQEKTDEMEERQMIEASIESHRQEVQSMMQRVLTPNSPQVFPSLQEVNSVVVNDHPIQLAMLGIQPIERSASRLNISNAVEVEIIEQSDEQQTVEVTTEHQTVEIVEQQPTQSNPTRASLLSSLPIAPTSQPIITVTSSEYINSQHDSSQLDMEE